MLPRAWKPVSPFIIGGSVKSYLCVLCEVMEHKVEGKLIMLRFGLKMERQRVEFGDQPHRHFGILMKISFK